MQNLPEKWAIRQNTHQDVIDWFKIMGLGEGSLTEMFKYLLYPTREGSKYADKVPDGYEEITLEQFYQITRDIKMLEPGEKILVFDIQYTVCKNTNGWYLNASAPNSNSDCFKTMQISKEELQRRVLGYSDSGAFPYCKTIEDLSKFADAIIKTDSNKIVGYKAPYDLFKGLIKAGELFTKEKRDGSDYYCPDEFPSSYHVVSEIVETWEPVFKKQDKIFDINHSTGTFKVKVDLRGFHYMEEGVLINPDELKLAIEPKTESVGGYKVEKIFSHVNIGCKKNVPIDDINSLFEFYEMITK